MTTFLLAFLVMVFTVSIMAIGVILKDKPIRGTCASLSNFGGNLGSNGECVVCGKKSDDESICKVDLSSAMHKRLYYTADKPEKPLIH